VARSKAIGREWGLVSVRDARLRVDREQNVIIGAKAICQYIGLKSYPALYHWIDRHAFPAVMRPDGMWMTTMTAIDEWIFLCLLSDKAIEERKTAAPSRAALIAAEATGFIAEKPTTSQLNNERKREWERRTGKSPRHYEANDVTKD
jgi:hypothetical protein